MSYVTDNIFIDVDSVLPVTCNGIVMLDARLVGDSTGHTFVWEQLSGTPVEWLESVYQTTVTFRQPATKDDKVFRFTLDKGTLIEKHKDILVTAVPTDYLTTRAGTSVSQEVDIDPPISAIVPAIRTAGTQRLNDADRSVVSYNTVFYDNRSPNTITLQELRAGSFVPIASVSAPSTIINSQLSPAVVDRLYRLKLTGSGSARYTNLLSTNSSTFVSVPELAIHDDALVTSVKGGVNHSTVVEVITRQLLQDAIPEASDTLYSGSIMLDPMVAPWSVVEVINRTLIRDTFSETTETMATTVIGTVDAVSVVVEVKAQQYSSLG